MTIKECILCGEPYEGMGHNPEPLVSYDAGRACGTCNDTQVIPARIDQYRLAADLNGPEVDAAIDAAINASAPDEVNERATGVAAAADTAVSGRSEHRSPIWHVAPGTENESACAPDEVNEVQT